MTSYLLYRGMNVRTVGICRGVSSAIGLLGTILYQMSAKRMTIISVGMWSIVFQFVCISCSMISMFIDDFMLSMSLMIIGVCASRLGCIYHIAYVVSLVGYKNRSIHSFNYYPLRYVYYIPIHMILLSQLRLDTEQSHVLFYYMELVSIINHPY
jgi:Ferroportin1 (FPN1)